MASFSNDSYFTTGPKVQPSGSFNVVSFPRMSVLGAGDPVMSCSAPNTAIPNASEVPASLITARLPTSSKQIPWGSSSDGLLSTLVELSVVLGTGAPVTRLAFANATTVAVAELLDHRLPDASNASDHG